MKILIYGLAKTGTSALFYKIRNSLPGTIALFEPVSRGPVARLRVALKTALTGRRHPDTLAKVLLFGPREARLRDFESFDKQILIVRDPRDRLVSFLLYAIYDCLFIARDDAVREYIALLRRKEADPAAVPLAAIIERLMALNGRPGWDEGWREKYRHEAVTGPIAFHRERPALRVLRYEDMVDDRLEPLEAYLGFPLTGAAEVEAAVKRVERTRAYGGWRDWWTDEDVALIGPVIQPYLDHYYPEADWRLASAPSLDPEHGSLYVARVANERRTVDGLSQIAW